MARKAYKTEVKRLHIELVNSAGPEVPVPREPAAGRGVRWNIGLFVATLLTTYLGLGAGWRRGVEGAAGEALKLP